MLKSWLGVTRSESRQKSGLEVSTEAIVGIFSPPEYKFEEGQNYEISSREGHAKPQDIMNPATGTGCIFRYEGKRGIHHCFREVRGGWTRTYTDTQLIGKRIREA